MCAAKVKWATFLERKVIFSVIESKRSEGQGDFTFYSANTALHVTVHTRGSPDGGRQADAISKASFNL